MPFQLSPGVAVVEKDFSAIVPAVSTSRGATVGSYVWGPVLAPVQVTSENELVQIFGKPQDANAQAFFTAANFLSYTNSCLVTRTDGTNARNSVSSQSGSVFSINLGSGGTNYTSVPTVTLSAPQITGGIQATATITLSGGSVTGALVTSGGSGYTSPTVTFSAPQLAGGITATGTVTVVSGSITAIVIVNAGSGYTSAPTAFLTPAGNAVLGAISISGSSIASITKVYSGSGYTSAPTVTISGGGGSGATATTSITTSGAKINNSTDYISSWQDGQGVFGEFAAKYPGALGNSLQVVMCDASTYNYISSINVTSGGSGYSGSPTVTFSAPQVPGGITATGTVTISGTVVTAIVITNKGTGYTSAPTVTISGGNGSGATAIAIMTAWTYSGQFSGGPGTSPYATSVGTVNDELHIAVIDQDGLWTGNPGTILEKFPFVSKSSDCKSPNGTSNYYKNVINSDSKYVWWLDHPAIGTNWGTTASVGGISTVYTQMATPYSSSLTGGADDLNATDGQLMTAWALYADDAQYDISLLPCGAASATVANYVISNIAELRLDCVAFVSPQDTSSGLPTVGNGTAAVSALIAYRNLLPSSSYAVCDSGYKYQYDRYNDKYRFIPLNGDVAGLCARTDNTNDPWFSPGGLNRGQIKNVVKLAVNLTKADRDSVYSAGINPVVTFPGEGTVLYGDKTLLAKPSAFDRINVRRLFIVMEKAIATAAKFQLFEFNDSFTQAQFRNLVEPFLRSVQGRRGITDFSVICDNTNNTGEIIDSNQFVAHIYVKPNRSINFITLNFVAARSSISFTEVGV
jgi:phage tail sheath protein FI